MKKPAIVILAAGNSSRMGEPKQLLSFKNNTLLGTVIQNCKATEVSNTYCVLGANAAKIQSTHQEFDIDFIINNDYYKGLSSSIKKAVEVILDKEATYSGILFLLGDQPYITSMQIEKYLKLHNAHPDKVIATTYNKGDGVPAFFPSRHLTTLLDLEGDAGAKQLIETFKDKILIRLSKESLIDIDTQKDYQDSLKHYNK